VLRLLRGQGPDQDQVGAADRGNPREFGTLADRRKREKRAQGL
jgi:hypothetical protein